LLQNLQIEVNDKLAQVVLLFKRLDENQIEDSFGDQEQVHELRLLVEKLPKSIETKDNKLKEMKTASIEYEDVVKDVEKVLRRLDNMEVTSATLNNPTQQLKEKQVSIYYGVQWLKEHHYVTINICLAYLFCHSQ